MRFIYIFMLTLFISACGPLAVSHTPHFLHQGDGEVYVGEFEYAPSTNGTLDANQIENTALGSAKIDKNVSDFFKQALLSELKYAGFALRDSGRIIEGKINRFLCDDLGYSVDWTVDVEYFFKKDESDVEKERKG